MEVAAACPASMEERALNNLRTLLFSSLVALAPFGSATVVAQDMRGLDVTSDAFTKAEMTRADIEAGLAALGPGAVLDLSGKSLNGLDLSSMDLRRTKLQSARINKVNLKGANLEAVVLDQAWSLKSDLTGAKLKADSYVARTAEIRGIDRPQCGHFAVDRGGGRRSAARWKSILSSSESDRCQMALRSLTLSRKASSDSSLTYHRWSISRPSTEPSRHIRVM